MLYLPTIAYFNPRPPHGGRLRFFSGLISPSLFQSTPSSRRATQSVKFASSLLVFQSTPSSRRATQNVKFASSLLVFQSTPSSRRATRCPQCAQNRIPVFQSTPSSRRATTDFTDLFRMFHISIHALLTEGDSIAVSVGAFCIISIHALLTEGDPDDMFKILGAERFQSTPSSRRATYVWLLLCRSFTFQSTPSSRRATCLVDLWLALYPYFNPRPPHGGRPHFRRFGS